MNTFSLSPLFRRSIGFDRFNDFFETALKSETPNYPPYNIEKAGDNDYRIVVAAAGFSPDELDVKVENRLLVITGSKESKTADENAINYLHQGIAQRAFKLSFRLDEQIEVKTAEFTHGLLRIELLRIIPETQRPRQINIQSGDKITLKTAHRENETSQSVMA